MKARPILHVMRFVPVIGMLEELVVTLEDLAPEHYLSYFKIGHSYPFSPNGGVPILYIVSDIRQVRISDELTHLNIVLLPDSAWDTNKSN